MSTLADDLVRIPQRETAGARSANRFAYQRSYALCRLLDLHEQGGDYVLLGEFHDDVAILDSATSPTSIEFVQVKTRQSGKVWTRADLVARKKSTAKEKSTTLSGRLPSILGKLYVNYLAFTKHTSRLAFVSNVPCKFTRQDGTACDKHPSTCLDELKQPDRTHICEKLATEHDLQSLPGGENLTFLEISDLSLPGHDSGTLGKLTAFLHRGYSNTPVPAVAFHKTLKSELERRCTREALPSSLDELVSSHGIRREEFEEMLATAATPSHTERLTHRIETRLTAEGVPVRVTLRLVRAVNRYTVDRRNPMDSTLREAAQAATQAIKRPTSTSTRLIEILEEVRPNAGDPLHQIESIRGIDYRKAIVAVALYEEDDDEDNDQLPPTHPQGPDQSA